jgi:hypothetical protein
MLFQRIGCIDRGMVAIFISSHDRFPQQRIDTLLDDVLHEVVRGFA